MVEVLVREHLRVKGIAAASSNSTRAGKGASS
jgi:hypothetical protein